MILSHFGGGEGTSNESERVERENTPLSLSQSSSAAIVGPVGIIPVGLARVINSKGGNSFTDYRFTDLQIYRFTDLQIFIILYLVSGNRNIKTTITITINTHTTPVFSRNFRPARKKSRSQSEITHVGPVDRASSFRTRFCC